MLVLAKGILNAPLNLLSGIYTPKREYSKHLLLWRNAAIVILVALVLALVNKGLNIHQLNVEREGLQQQTGEIFKQVMGSSRMVNVRSQMESQLRTLQGAGGGMAFFTMLDDLAVGFDKVPELKPTSLRFDGGRNELRMQITAKSYAQIEQFKELISPHFQVDSGAMNSGEDEVTSTLTLRSK